MPAWGAFLPDKAAEALVACLGTSPPTYDGAKIEPVTLPAEVSSSEASIRRGQKMLQAFECNKCHGEAGRGDPAPGLGPRERRARWPRWVAKVRARSRVPSAASPWLLLHSKVEHVLAGGCEPPTRTPRPAGHRLDLGPGVGRGQRLEVGRPGPGGPCPQKAPQPASEVRASLRRSCAGG